MEDKDTKIEKVIKGNAVIHKKTFGEKVVSAFVATEFKEALSDVTKNVAIPAIKRTFIDMVYNTLNSVLFGTSGTGSKWMGNSNVFGGTTFRYSAPEIDYSGISSSSKRTPAQYNTLPTYDEIKLDNYDDANKVLDTLQAIIDRHGSVSISHLYTTVGLPAISSYYNYGWKNLSGASIGVVTGGYLLKLPKAIPLD